MKRTSRGIGWLAGVVGLALGWVTGLEAGVYDGWGYWMKLSFPRAVGEPLTNFPTLVALSANISGFGYDQFQSATNGGDLQFADSNTTTEWNTNESSYVWV